VSEPAPVGIFDSGIGGLSVAREIRRLLPAEHLLYLADSAWVPYGDLPVETVRARTLAAGRELQRRGAKLLVVACNTASGAALELLREQLRIPVVGLEPAVKPAVRHSRNGRVGVMATVGTLASARYARLVEAHGNGAQVLALPCPGLADLIEEGHLDDPLIRTRLEALVEPLRQAGVDTVVLGCTHYPFIQQQIAEALGPGVRIVDSGPAIARQTARVLTTLQAHASGGAGSLRLLTTGDPAEVGAVAGRIWGAPIPTAPLELVPEAVPTA
jgi:glutamate racemase